MLSKLCDSRLRAVGTDLQGSWGIASSRGETRVWTGSVHFAQKSASVDARASCTFSLPPLPRQPLAPEGRYRPKAPNLLRGTHVDRLFAAEDDHAWVFAVPEHWNAECVGGHACSGEWKEARAV